MSQTRPENEYVENFKNVVKEPYHLTPIGFNEVSEINYYSYQNYYRKSWYDIIKDYGEFDKVYDYITDEILDFYQIEENNIKLFFNNHKYITSNITKYVDINNILKIHKFNYKKQNRTLDELMDNFISLKNKLGHVPSYTEFKDNSYITIKAYAKYFNIKETSYDNIIKFLCLDDEYKEFKQRQKLIRRNNAKNTGIHNIKYSNKDLEEEIKKVFNETKEKYNVYPSRKYFNIISKYDDSVYRYRFNKSWTEICKMFGYDITNKKSAEYIVLGKISEILQSDYTSQKSWDWLKGIKGCALRVDGYFEDYNFAVEFDGRQHKEPVIKYGGEKSFKVLKSNDEIKDKLIPEHGIKLLRISAFDDWFNEVFLKGKLKQIHII